jgi:hypothetical protein
MATDAPEAVISYVVGKGSDSGSGVSNTIVLLSMSKGAISENRRENERYAVLTFMFISAPLKLILNIG